MTDAAYNSSDLLAAVAAGKDLSREQAQWAFGEIMDGRWSEAQIADLLVALRNKGESAEEIAGAATAMRAHSVKIGTGSVEVIDTCGTGGTGVSTFNISTAAALVAAGAGAKVAKHGNRTHTRASGSADVLAALGVKIDAAPAVVSRCLAEAGVCFCFAVTAHPAMKYAAPVRKAIGGRTIFNLLGPLTNPAGATRQIIGVFDEALTEKIARVLGMMGGRHAMVVHAGDGLDELSTTAATKISELRAGRANNRSVQPEDFAIKRAKLADLLVGSVEESAAAVREVLAGKPGPRRDIVVLNAAAAIYIAGLAKSITAGLPLAKKSIDSGAAKTAFEKLILTSNS